MRQIFLDTETTGLDPGQGHRVIELAAVEMVNRRLTGNRGHWYVNPEREIDEGALQVHGLSREFLQDKPRFRDVCQAFLDFISGAELVIHNAPFDVAFLDSELGMIGLPAVAGYCAGVVDTLKLAKELHPGKKNSLDALCERYQVDNSKRTLHGALLDAELLAEVYLAMTRGQDSLAIDMGRGPASAQGPGIRVEGLELPVIAASADELAAHAGLLEDIDKAAKGACLWKALGT
ncbi:MAG: DNA polymerase III subunit epsilon [Betaproteobacteria bacterium]|nr:DNA polymerase III subunit epsilon [Betaproteobacteria bacterium]